MTFREMNIQINNLAAKRVQKKCWQTSKKMALRNPEGFRENWMRTAMNKQKWKNMEDVYIQEWRRTV